MAEFSPEEISSVVQQFVPRATDNARSQAVLGIDQDPEKAKRAIELSKATGVPAEVIHGDVENFDQEHEKNLTSQIVESDPHLVRYANSNAMVGALSKGDWGNLAKLSQSMMRLVNPLDAVFNPAESLANAKRLWEGMNKGWGEGPLGSWMTQEDYNRHPGAWITWSAFGALGEVALKRAPGAVVGGLSALLAPLQSMVTGEEEEKAERGVSSALDFLMLHAMSHPMPHGTPHPLTELPPEKAIQFRQELTEAADAAKPWLDAGKEPPPGIHPIIDDLKKKQIAADIKRLDEAVKDAGATATRESAPDILAELPRSHTDQTLWVDAEVVKKLYGDKTPTPDDKILGWVPRIDEQLRLAEVAGGEIGIPVADYVARIESDIHKALKDNIRFREQGLTVEEAKKPIEAYHGSPHEFDAFDMSKIGTGEGAQSYGYGLYFAENPAVAADYAKKLSDWTTTDPTGGNKYRVRIHADKEQFLDWDRPLREQAGDISHKARMIDHDIWSIAADAADYYRRLSKKIGEKEASKALREAGIPGIKYLDQGSRNKVDAETRQMQIGELEELIKEENELGEKDEAGIKHLASLEKELADLQANPEALTHNFVLFDASLVEIIERNGEALRAVKAAYGLQSELPLPPSIAETKPIEGKAMGMTKRMQERHEKLIDRQNKEDEEWVRAQAQKIERRKQTREWKENEAAMWEEVTNDVEDHPSFVLANYFINGIFEGEKGPKPILNSEALSGYEKRSLPKGTHGFGGLLPDELAPLFGYDSGRDMVQALIEFNLARGDQPFRRYFDKTVQAEVNRRMVERYGDLEKNIIDSAEEHVLGATTMDRLHEDILAAAWEAGVEPTVTKKQIEAGVEELFGQRNAETVKKSEFERQVAKASRANDEATLKGDWQEAYKQRQRRFIQTLLAKEALDFEKEQKSFDKMVKRTAKGQFDKMPREFVDWGQFLLSKAYGSEIIKRNPVEFQESLAKSGHNTLDSWVASKIGDGYEMDVADYIRALEIKPVDQMTVAEWRDFRDALNSINEIGRKEYKVEISLR